MFIEDVRAIKALPLNYVLTCMCKIWSMTNTATIYFIWSSTVSSFVGIILFSHGPQPPFLYYSLKWALLANMFNIKSSCIMWVCWLTFVMFYCFIIFNFCFSGLRGSRAPPPPAPTQSRWWGCLNRTSITCGSV